MTDEKFWMKFVHRPKNRCLGNLYLVCLRIIPSQSQAIWKIVGIIDHSCRSIGMIYGIVKGHLDQRSNFKPGGALY